MKVNASSKVKEFKKNGISVRIRPTIKDGTTRFVLDYRVQGRRKLVWRSTLAKARIAANVAIDKITEGQAEVLNLKSADAHAYSRAPAILDGSEGETKVDLQIDEAVRIVAEVLRLLDGRATPLEVCRDWLKRNDVKLTRVTVADAVELLKKQAATDKKSQRWREQIAAVLDRLAESFNCEVHTLTPKLFADYLAALPFAERTKANHRDIIGFFNRWLILRGYLAKGTDWLEGVQKSKKRKIGKISTFTTDEMIRLIAAADDRILPLIVIGGFAGLRHSEIARLDWQDIDLAEGFIEVKPVEGTKSDETRRIVPIKDNLKIFMLPLSKKSGKVISVANTTKQLLKAAADTGDAAKEIKLWLGNTMRFDTLTFPLASPNVATCPALPKKPETARMLYA